MKRAFTVFEILIALAILGVLAAVVIPSLRMVQARAGSAKCLNQLRQLGTALNLYLGDHQMIMPTLKAARGSKEEDVAVIDNTLHTYVSDQRVFACPSDRKQADSTGTSYFWNSLLNGQPASSLNFSLLNLQVSDLSRIPILLDKEGWHHFTPDKVNHLFADGHVTNQLRLFAE